MPDHLIEKLVTLDAAAQSLGIHLWALRRAVRRGVIPSYTPFGRRRLVRVSEVLTYIDSSRQGGQQ
ncbi:helix-turn-helix domain-containing protein [Devosia albogilva]|uniref:Helix-turn-helix domain-containing protein n=1 Tax=Devosia albogilva TaxID=429726 RepID=A0ABW5QKJ2_9HYPH